MGKKKHYDSPYIPSSAKEQQFTQSVMFMIFVFCMEKSGNVYLCS